MPHTPIDHLLVADSSQPTAHSSSIGASNSDSPLSTPPRVSVPSYGRESAPASVTAESGSESDQMEEQSEQSEASKESAKKQENPKIRLVRDTPDIDPAAARAGLIVAPSAQPFPSLYETKVPFLTDDQIEEGLKASPLTGKRWLAELGRYILWQAHIQLRKVGDKVIRHRNTDGPTLLVRLKRLRWM